VLRPFSLQGTQSLWNCSIGPAKTATAWSRLICLFFFFLQATAIRRRAPASSASCVIPSMAGILKTFLQIRRKTNLRMQPLKLLVIPPWISGGGAKKGEEKSTWCAT
jgi:hypothetical protein